jgi:menaquinone-dependent protoporphyrinogen oxidase
MLRILVLYGTTDGHTAKIARWIGEAIRTEGIDVDVVEAGPAAVGPENYGAVVVAASVRAGAYQRSVQQWLGTHAPALKERPTAFVSVCLAVLQRDPKVEQHLTAIIDRFVTATGWQPTVKKSVAGALLYTRYNWFTRWFMKRIVRKAGGDTDTSRDHVYTDWNDLRAFAVQFAQLARTPYAVEGSAERPAGSRVA